MNLEILSTQFLKQFEVEFDFKVNALIEGLDKIETPVNYFKFYNSISSVYSSKIEGEDIDFDSYFKYKFLNVNYQPNYTRRADDLFKAYEFIFQNELTFENLQRAHGLLSANLLPLSQQGFVRTNPMFVLNSEDKIDYVAADHSKIKGELAKLFTDINFLISKELTHSEVLFFGSHIHLTFVKIHPFQDGNGRSARLLEKWFLVQKLGKKATAVQLEKNYFLNLLDYYKNLKKLGVDYELLDYGKAFDFFKMTASGLINQSTC